MFENIFFLNCKFFLIRDSCDKEKLFEMFGMDENKMILCMNKGSNQNPLGGTISIVGVCTSRQCTWDPEH